VTIESTQAFYGRWARAYDALCRVLPGLDGLRRDAVDSLALAPGDTVVDLGCGTGANLRHLRDAVGPTGTVIGVDLTRGMLAQARERVEDAGWENVHLAQADAAGPPVRAVDAIFASFVVGMLENPGESVERWTERLRTGGRVAVVEAGRSNHRVARFVNPVFDALVGAGAPENDHESPSTALDSRIDAARGALATHSRVVRDERRAAGFVRVFTGELV
jgi:ubiquinone/menaquinone biosynthesis C-methylase UbiE